VEGGKIKENCKKNLFYFISISPVFPRGGSVNQLIKEVLPKVVTCCGSSQPGQIVKSSGLDILWESNILNYKIFFVIQNKMT
jgi:hypothetical protein